MEAERPTTNWCESAVDMKEIRQSYLLEIPCSLRHILIPSSIYDPENDWAKIPRWQGLKVVFSCVVS